LRFKNDTSIIALTGGYVSSSYANETTRKKGGINREIETRMAKLDVFTDDFSSPGDAARDIDPRIKSRYQKGGYSQDTKDQEELDFIDRVEQKMNGGIKKIKDQFPGAALKKDMASLVERTLVMNNYFKAREMFKSTKDDSWKLKMDECKSELKRMGVIK
jgi:hypothetical protein